MRKFYKLLAVMLFFALLGLNTEVKSNTDNSDIAKLESVNNLSKTFNNEIKAVFCDIDGTIIPKGYPKGKVPESVKRGAKKLRDANIPLILATGRTYQEAKEIADIIGNKNAYFITLQGSEIVNDKGKLIYKDCLYDEDAKIILKNLDKFTDENAPKAKTYFFINETPNSTKIFKLPYSWHTIVLVKSYDSIDAFTPSKIGVYEDKPEKLRMIRAYLKETFPKYNSYLSTDYCCELTTYTATKGNGVKKITETLGIEIKNVATFSDAENDVSMSSLVKNNGGLAVAVKNAMAILKQNANYETLDVREGGFTHAVDKIIENNKRLKQL